MRVLFISSIPPIPTYGSAMTFYRHFCERNDFVIGAITNDNTIAQYNVSYPYLVIDKSWICNRVSNTRFYMMPHTWGMLVGSLSIPKRVIKFAKEFKPDAIFTMAGSWTWMAILAQKVSKKMKIPLIGSFNDWWYYNTIYHPLFHNVIEAKFRKFYRNCDLALCTSEGMQEELGGHPNAVIIYPTGSSRIYSNNENTVNRVFTVAFGGSLGEWYGQMMESLITASKDLPIRFKIFGQNPSWSKSFDIYVKDNGIYEGQIPFEQLQRKMKMVDALLLFMGFEEKYRIIEATSFKTKFLDYLAFEKPILLWGPSYCSAAVVAKEFNCAEICNSPNPNDFIKSIIKVKESENLRKKLVINAREMYNERFNPDKIHSQLKSKILCLLDKQEAKNEDS